MKTLSITFFTLLLIGFASVGSLSAQSATPGINHSQRHQSKRISQGIASGELTRGEAYRLGAQQVSIRRDIRYAKSDGVVTPYERRNIQHRQQRASANIYVQKRDRRDRH